MTEPIAPQLPTSLKLREQLHNSERNPRPAKRRPSDKRVKLQPIGQSPKGTVLSQRVRFQPVTEPISPHAAVVVAASGTSTPRANSKTRKKGGDSTERESSCNRSVKAQGDVWSQRVRFQPIAEPISSQAAGSVAASEQLTPHVHPERIPIPQRRRYRDERVKLQPIGQSPKGTILSQRVRFQPVTEPISPTAAHFVEA